MAATDMPRVKLGSQGLEVSKLGYGCMGLTGIYNNPVPEEEGIAIIKEAFSKGVTFFDTSDIYGANHANEYLVGKALKHLPREKVQLATKFGVCKIDLTEVVLKGTPEYVRSCCEASLKRLQVDYIDLYYIHRIDTTVPIEETGELGIGLVAIQPVGCGLFGGKAVVESLPTNSFSGTTKMKNLHDNIDSVKLKLTKEELKEICDAVPISEVAGQRIGEAFYKTTYRYGITPPLKQ
nr:perakine reductase-like [Ipomoea batatas]